MHAGRRPGESGGSSVEDKEPHAESLIKKKTKYVIPWRTEYYQCYGGLAFITSYKRQASVGLTSANNYPHEAS